jgi:hypothetical protein
MKKLLTIVAATALIMATPLPAVASIQEWAVAFERLLAGLKVHDRQIGGSSSQTQQVVKKSQQARTEAVNAQDLALKIADIKQRMSYETGTGEVACGIAETWKGLNAVGDSEKQIQRAFHNAEKRTLNTELDGAAMIANSIAMRKGHYCTLEEAAKLGGTYCVSRPQNERNAGDSNAAPFLLNRNYGPQEVVVAGDYLDTLAPYPTLKPNPKTVGEQMLLIEARQKAAMLSGARSAMIGVAMSAMGGGGEL